MKQKMNKKEEFLSVYERQQVWLPYHQEKDFGKRPRNYFFRCLEGEEV